MKKRIFLASLFVVLMLIGGIAGWLLRGNSGTKEGSDQEGIAPEVISDKVTSRDRAIILAQDFLENQSYASEYDISSAHPENFKDFWNVWFDTKDKSKRPNKGLVQVDKKTEKALWKELQ